MSEWRKRVVDGVPLPFLTRPHELTIAGVLAVVGAPALFGALPGQDSPYNPIPDPLWHGWGGWMVLAAVLTIVGVFTNRVRMEWTGQLLAGYGLVFFSAILASLGGLRDTYPTVLVFVLLAMVSWWRCFKLSSASYVQYRLARAARYAHVQVAEKQKKERRGHE